MRTPLYAAVISLTMLSGCATMGPPGGSGGSIIEQVQQITANVCAFLPTATTVINIVAAGNPALQTAGQIAHAICAALTTPPGARASRSGSPTVAGVVIRGRRL